MFIWRKLSLYEGVALFSINFFKNRSLWYSEILIFSGIFRMIPNFMGYVNYESAKEMAEYVFLKKSCHYLKKLQFSL